MFKLDGYPLRRDSVRFNDGRVGTFYLSTSLLSVRDRVVLEGADSVLAYLLYPKDLLVKPGDVASVENTPFRLTVIEERRHPVPGLMNRSFLIQLTQRVHTYKT